MNVGEPDGVDAEELAEAVERTFGGTMNGGKALACEWCGEEASFVVQWVGKNDVLYNKVLCHREGSIFMLANSLHSVGVVPKIVLIKEVAEPEFDFATAG
jgi:hypothetical protein